MKNEIGLEEWFRNKALASITKIEEGVWDYSDSSVLYTPQFSSLYEEVQKDAEHNGYKKKVTDEETLFIETIASTIIKSLPNNFAYIDLGPGTEHKEKFFQDAILAQNKNALYVPVDVSEQMLNIANDYAKNRGFKTYPLHQTFENLDVDLQDLPNVYRFVSLGLTFTNYEPKKILKILNKIIALNGSLFITAQLRERVNMSEIQKIYSEVIATMLPNKLNLVNVNFEQDIANIEVTDGVEIYARLKNISPELKAIGVQSGDKLLLLRSYRYELKELKETLKGYEVEYYDEGGQFAGCLIRIGSNLAL